MSNQTAPPKRRGCLFYGCLSLTILSLLLALFVGVGFYFAKKTWNRLVDDYTETAPARIEERAYPEAQMRELQARLGNFRREIDKAGAAAQELVLTADDLNALIAHDPDWKGKVFVKIEDDRVKGQVSMALPDIGPLKLKGRYLNGAAAFKVSVGNGTLDVRVTDIMVKGKPLPALILNELKKQNWAEKAQSNPETAGVIQKIESIEIHDDKATIRSRPAPGAQP